MENKALTAAKSYSDSREDILNGHVSCVETVRHFLNKINEKAQLNAFLEVFEESALEQAKAIDHKIANGQAGKLAGMVIGIKDNICYKGHKVSASSKILKGFESLYSATVIERLLAEDAIIIGRLNCDEFAMGSSNENSAFGNVLNPHDPTRVTGGSSGGSAAAVAAGLCHVTLGSDTGGSIRQPASFCGIVGLKPTYGRVSRWGLLAYASSFDQIGPLAHSVKDTALVMEVMAGADEFDSTASTADVPPYSERLTQNSKLKVAYLKDCLENDGLNPEIKSHINTTIKGLQDEGHTVEAVDFPYLDHLVPAYYVLTTAEASSNLSRYAGILYGHQSSSATDLESTYKKSRTEGFGKEVKRRIMLGTFVLSAGYYDAYYSKAQKVRRILQDKVNEILNDYDFIILPTTPDVAFRIGENANDPIKMYLEDIFTVLANLVGTPAISLPTGKSSQGLPFGVQLIGKRNQEDKLLAFSQYLMEKAD